MNAAAVSGAQADSNSAGPKTRRLAFSGTTTGLRAGLPRVIIVPGLFDSGVAHWQTLWGRAHPEYRRVQQRDWNKPDLAAWSAVIDGELNEDRTPAILVAHSFGCLAAVVSAVRNPGRVAAALLVAPANPARFGIEHALHVAQLPFTSVLVASRNDPWLPFDVAAGLARAWGSRLVDLGDAGHINADSGYGAWPEGERLLFEIVRGLQTRERVAS
jgi:predicted alpha/beta hydrolase family esterase